MRSARDTVAALSTTTQSNDSARERRDELGPSSPGHAASNSDPGGTPVELSVRHG